VRVALIEFALFDAIDELLDLVHISGGDVIVVVHRRRSRRSYARQKRTPRPERKYFLFSRGLTAGTLNLRGMLPDSNAPSGPHAQTGRTVSAIPSTPSALFSLTF
jgi:hypothetical protein